MWNPSFDFELFSVPMFSPLQANEFGAETSFRANTPTQYADYSLNQLLSILRTPNPEPFPNVPYYQAFDIPSFTRFFQSGTGDLPQGKDIIKVYPAPNPEAASQERQQAESESVRRGCSFKDIITGNCMPAILTPEGRARPKKEGETVEKAIPESLGLGQGFSKEMLYLVIGVVVLILFLLFVRR